MDVDHDERRSVDVLGRGAVIGGHCPKHLWLGCRGCRQASAAAGHSTGGRLGRAHSSPQLRLDRTHADSPPRSPTRRRPSDAHLQAMQRPLGRTHGGRPWAVLLRLCQSGARYRRINFATSVVGRCARMATSVQRPRCPNRSQMLFRVIGRVRHYCRLSERRQRLFTRA